MNKHSFQFEDKINTNYTGYNQLVKFYHFCQEKPPQSTIHLDFTNVEFFDGNLSALLLAITYKLNKINGHSFSADTEMIKNRFDVLYRNGLFKDDNPIKDDRESTVPIQFFETNDKEGFCEYVEKELLCHRGMPKEINNELKSKISDDLLEVFCNTHHHANTIDPFFVGGQYYPTSGVLKFTMVDLGDGFLPRILKATNGEIKDSLKSIEWALEGNSSKLALDHCPGGLGIKNMYKYCKDSKGILQIISGNGYWSTELENTVFQGGRILPKSFVGTTINLFFKKS